MPKRDDMPDAPTSKDLRQQIFSLERENEALRQAGALSRHMEERFKTFLRMLPLGAHMYRLEDDGRLIFSGANPAADKILGVDNQRFIGNTIEEAFPTLVGTEIPERYRRICRDGEVWYAEQIDYRDDAIQGAFEVHAFQTAPGQMVALFSDITDRKRDKISLRRSEKMYRQIIEEAADGICIFDAEGRIHEVNPYLCRMSGYSREEFLRLNIEAFFTAEDHAEIPVRLAELAAGETVAVEKRVIRKDGMTIYAAISARKVEEGRFQAIVRDVTERRLAEEALRLEKEKLQRLLDKSPVGVALIVRDGTYQYVNPKFTHIFGYTLEDIPTGRDWFQKAYPETEYRETVRRAWRADMSRSDSGELPARTYTVTAKDGSEKLIQFRAVTMEDGAQFIIYDDITEKTRLETRLQMAQKMEAIGTLAGGIAHDFNNILSAIIGYTEIAMMDIPRGSPTESNLKQVLSAGDRARDLVKQILAFSRLGNQEFKPLLVKPIVKETMKLLRASLPATIEIRQQISSDATVMADPTQIHQIIMNLCTNAAHAMEDTGGILEVSLVDADLDEAFTRQHPDMIPGSYVQLRVTDTGHGMSPEVLHRIFDPFFTTKSDGKGTGMGLSVVHGIVHNHGGTISVDSTMEDGTRFDVYLPMIPKETAHEKPTPDALPTGREHILIIDDEPFQADIGKQVLERLGYTVETQNDGNAALDLFQKQPDAFDLVITDMTMPKITGDRLAQKMLDIRPDLPIILCTGYSERMTEDKARMLGIRGYAMKPIVMKEIAGLVRKILDGSHENPMQ